MEVIGKTELLSILQRYHNMVDAASTDEVKSCVHGVQADSDGKLKFIDGNGNVVAELELKGGIDESDIATNDEVSEMLDDIFGSDGTGGTGEEIATNEEVQELLDDIFN